jgi:Uma2 family endonuclease
MPNAQPRLTPQDYLAWERQQETRHDYVNGEIYAMTGASRKHNVICANLLASLHGQLRERPCEVYANDMRVKVDATGLYTYPDLVVACDQPAFEDDQIDTLLNPVLIVEILSESTAGYDRGAKFAHYRNLPSLQEYLLVAQDAYRVEHYVRQPGERWLLSDYRGLEEYITLASIDCRLPLHDLYARIAPESLA